MEKMTAIDLTKHDWTVAGWRPFSWRLGVTMETNSGLRAEIGPVPAKVPGSVHSALLAAGLLPDWNVGLQSRECAWVESYHWEFSTLVPARDLIEVELVAECLDYSGWVLLDGKEVASFSGAMVEHHIALPTPDQGADMVKLSIVFDLPPAEQGQIGATSDSRFYKPRYSYSWDWCPRLVPTGIAGKLKLQARTATEFFVEKVIADYFPPGCRGSLEAEVFAHGAPSDWTLLVCLKGDEGIIGEVTLNGQEGRNLVTWEGLDIAPWWPNGHGDQPLYTLSVKATSREGALLWSRDLTVGFKKVEWRACEGAPAGAEPWICVVNDQEIFLQGVNWTPIAMTYQDIPAETYAQRIGKYIEMGCNTLRVWGGGVLEGSDFFDLCDRHGLLVWQDFPLSSSGCDNWPPERAESISDIEKIATHQVRLHQHHVSLLLWCGGNELQGGLDGSSVGVGLPVGYDHPCISALHRIVTAHDPGRRFTAASPVGPRFFAERENFGKGIHHEVHGPWGFAGFQDMDDWKSYWQEDDALFRSEVAAVGASDLALCERYSGSAEMWPPSESWWKHLSAWWTQWERLGPELEKFEPRVALSRYVEITQAEQAEAIASAASACKERFPRCGGFLVWMGHDAVPCPSNTAILDFEGNPKPAFYALQKIFTENSEAPQTTKVGDSVATS